jgi:L-alanine-DL-glutamate epimerase-like enolase superfamily enzyme
MAKIVSVEARTVHIPLRQATAFARRQVTSRDYSLVRIRTEDGVEGIGHCYAGHSGGNVVTTAVREMLAPMLIGADPRDGIALEKYVSGSVAAWPRRLGDAGAQYSR